MGNIESPAENEISSPLTEFGLTRQETSVYIGLLSNGDMNGYEVAKNLGLSRSNAYTALASLADKGAAWIIEGSPVRYTAVPIKEFCANRIHHLEKLRDTLLSRLPEKKEGQGAYITINGRERILDRLRHLIEEAEERVYLALEGSVLSLFSSELRQLLSGGKKVVVITDNETAAIWSSDQGLSGVRVYIGNITTGQIRAIADSHFVLTGDISAGSQASCLFSDRKNLVDLFKSALRNEIRLIELDNAVDDETKNNTSGAKTIGGEL